MPELPELEVVQEVLNRRVIGQGNGVAETSVIRLHGPPAQIALKWGHRS